MELSGAEGFVVRMRMILTCERAANDPADACSRRVGLVDELRDPVLRAQEHDYINRPMLETIVKPQGDDT